MTTDRSKRKLERINLHKRFTRIRSRILSKVNLMKHYANKPSSYVYCSLLWFDMDNRYFSIRTGRGANYGVRSQYFNIHQNINVLGFDLSFEYRYNCK